MSGKFSESCHSLKQISRYKNPLYSNTLYYDTAQRQFDAHGLDPHIFLCRKPWIN